MKSDFDLEVLSILYVYHTSIELSISFEIAKNSTHISECSFLWLCSLAIASTG